ncbi:MAG: Acriflavin resistance protein [Candidatus Moranbacteria bacterium GW2011_GWF1_34_10]|nr:MAG: Acriflavin resistance protein [Candidatus Moranbacteria bacterium GW2011_GWF1_34_10]
MAYLEKLQFDPKLKKSWLNFFVVNFRVVILLIILMSAWGIYSYIKLPRESNPEVKIPIAVITAVYPGASPSDVEELVTKKIETNISGVSGIDKITSQSTNSFSSVTVEFNANEDVEDAVRKLRDKLPDIEDDLPEDADDPQVIEISFDDTPIITFELTGPFDGFVLREHAEKIQDELEKISGIREVKISGGDEKEFDISYDPQKLSFFNISLDQANQAVIATNQAIPAGNFEGKQYNYPVRTDARFYDAETLGNFPISHQENGAIVYLRDIAKVEERAIEKTILSRFSQNGQPPQNSISIAIIKRTGSSILDTVEQARNTIDEQLKTFPSGLTYAPTVNMAELIEHDFEQLAHDFIITLVLVVGVLFLVVGLKEAFVAGLAIPLVFFCTFGVMLMTGTSLNFLSIFSLLLALGLLVDDAIVVVSATKQYMKTGKFTPEEAVLLVLNDFKVVLTTTTLATIWAFLPLLMASGIIGEYIKSIPITVSVTLFASLIIALMINHPLAAVLERIRMTKKFFFLIIFLLLVLGIFAITFHNIYGYIFSGLFFMIVIWMLFWYFKKGTPILKQNELLATKEWKDDELIKKKLYTQANHESDDFGQRLIHGIIHFDRVLPIYEKYLKKIILTKKSRWSFIGAIIILFIFSVSLPIFGIVKTEFFPVSDAEEIYISMRAPAGLNLEESDKIIQKVEEKLYKYPEIINFSTLVGNPGSGGDVGIVQDTSNTASITIKLSPVKERERKSYEITNAIRNDIADIQEATIKVSSPSGGPPAGAAFQAQIMGDDLQKLDKVANDLKIILDSIEGTINTDTSLKESPAEYTFKLDPAKMELYNLNASLVGMTLRTAISGNDISNVIQGNDDIDVVARFDENKIPALDSIQNLQILNTLGQPVYLKDVANIELKPSVEAINRIDQKRTVLLTAGADASTNSNQILAQFQDKLATDYQLPQGYEITYGGENEQNAESVASILRAMIIAGILILSTMIIQFNSFRKSLIVLVTLPLALIGTFLGLAIFGISLSFPGLIGILALFGIVVKNAIILIDKINLNLESQIPFMDSVVDAGKSRLEAIFVTSICTIFGIVPITLSNELWRALGSAVIFGLILSSFLTLFLVPVLFVTFIKEKK